MCLGTFSRLARSLATIYIFARVRIIGTLVPFCVIGNSKEFPVTQKSTSSRECASLAHECLLCNREFLGISYYTKNGSKLCNLLTDIRCRLSTFRPVSSIYMAPTTGSYGRSQVRRLQLPQTSQEDPGLSGVSSPLRPHHRSRGLRSS